MRLVVGMLAVVLASPVAAAEDGAPARVETKAEAAGAAPARQKVPVRVVRILPETSQALLYDPTGLRPAPRAEPAGSPPRDSLTRIDRSGGGTHLLVTVGEKIGDYTVEAIDEDEVTLSANGQQIVLAAPERPWRRHGGEGRAAAERPAAERPAAARGGEPGPADPYGGPAAPHQAAGSGGAASSSGGAPDNSSSNDGAPGPADPYAAEIREVKAPSWLDPTLPMPTARPVTATATPPSPAPSPTMTAPAPAPSPTMPPPSPAPSSTMAPPSPASSSTMTPPLSTTTAPAPATAAPAPAAAAPGADAVLSRREVDAALADFGALSVAFRASFTPAGLKIDAVLDGSLFAKAGLRAGDVVASVDGKPLRSLDDVAALYARAGSLRAVTAQVVRGGKPLTLRAVIQ